MVDVRIGVLGPVTAVVGGGAVPLGGPRQRAVLAVLVAAGGRAVTQDALIAAAWDGDGAASSATLHSYIGRLRKLLEPARGPRQPARAVTRVGGGYALGLPAGAVDADRFTALAARGGRLLRAGDPAAAATVLHRALDLWRGPAYADLADAAFAAPERARLEALRLAARQDLYTAQLALGGHAALVGELEKHTAEHPLDERGWELLALALYRSGRQGDALGALRAARRTLARELGADPGPGLRRTEAALLAHDPSAAPPAPPAARCPAGRASRPAAAGVRPGRRRPVCRTRPASVPRPSPRPAAGAAGPGRG
ncbi:AfsR/SARP family transcriptional regulator, partial [Streptomyces capparidis]